MAKKKLLGGEGRCGEESCCVPRVGFRNGLCPSSIKTICSWKYAI